MTFFTPLQQRFSACLAILAVLMLFVAPVVSKDLMARHGSAMSAAAMPLTHSVDALPMMHHMDDGMMHPDSAMAPSEGVACGYCELLIHVPLMLWTTSPLIWLIMIIARAPPPPRVIPPLRRRDVRVYRPRAPPLATPFNQDV
ncbi:DUF2946 domain-containing protein [Pantoea sp. KPR_PJ]|uniref:DUF2946 domain-containing protein n=1 Tax=Pantoea sp. KPR_PJ TaxID=2738375 RepID=UPI003529819C